jgi:uncharacterized protein (DUF433 family)
MIEYQKFITIQPDKRSGQPCIRGMRITVYDILSYLAAEDSMEEILAGIPMPAREDTLACLAYAADTERKFVYHILK